MQTLVWAEKSEMISEDFTSIQKFFNTMSRLRLSGLLSACLLPFLPIMRGQLASKFPSVRVLDLYKFYYFSKYKHKG